MVHKERVFLKGCPNYRSTYHPPREGTFLSSSAGCSACPGGGGGALAGQLCTDA